MNRPLIVLDADGVLLDYNAAYAQAWARAFGEAPALHDEQAYWAADRWGVGRLSGGQLQVFSAYFDEQFWATVPALPGAVDACDVLSAAGFELICVTAIEAEFAEARQENLRQHGFPITRVVAVEHRDGPRSCKADAIESLRPVAFVDDFLAYHFGIKCDSHKALIVRDPRGSPNRGPGLVQVDSMHTDLSAFAQWWLGREASRNKA